MCASPKPSALALKPEHLPAVRAKGSSKAVPAGQVDLVGQAAAVAVEETEDEAVQGALAVVRAAQADAITLLSGFKF
jgi:hypothetical protein